MFHFQPVTTGSETAVSGRSSDTLRLANRSVTFDELEIANRSPVFLKEVRLANRSPAYPGSVVEAAGPELQIANRSPLA